MPGKIANDGAVHCPIDAISHNPTLPDPAWSGPSGQSIPSASRGQPVEFFIRKTAGCGPKPKNTDFPLLKVLRTPRTIGGAHFLAAPGRSAVLCFATMHDGQG
jgi:hypothetical protein